MDLGPYKAQKLLAETIDPATRHKLAAQVYFPVRGANVDDTGVPFAALVFVPGTLVPGSFYAGTAEHLASHGYVVAVPSHPRGSMEDRTFDVQRLLSYLEGENSNSKSPLYRVIDVRRFATLGHSLGGTTALAVAARDRRVEHAVVALDPVNPARNRWDCEEEGEDVAAAVGLIGAPAHLCNWYGRYEKEFPSIGRGHKAKIIITGASHCEFMGPTNPLARLFCTVVCGGYLGKARMELIAHYTRAWLDYYVRLQADRYDCLYGDRSAHDIRLGLIRMEVHTAPSGLVANGRPGAVELRWGLCRHPIVEGYNVYRSVSDGEYGDVPYAQVGVVDSYLDTDVVPGVTYGYRVRSIDEAGNEHQNSDVVTAVPGTEAQSS
ncbi:alpha/beta fold hydrolase [Chloroflexota bacterium]